MMKTTKSFAILVALAAMAAAAVAQQGQPRGKAEATINGKKVMIDYGRPALKGRTLDALLKDLPEDRIWRAGENQVTTLETGTTLNIGGKTIPAGKYSLYVHAPAEGDWSLCVNKNLGVPLGEIWDQAPPEMKKEPWPMLMGYQENIGKDEVARIPMKKSKGDAQDVFTIAIKEDALTLSWGDVSWGTTIQSGT